MQSKLLFPRSIRYLMAVAEHHSFTRAAEALYVSQPTLSQQIKLLEEALDVQLLDRSGRDVRLTEAGEVYVRHAKRALSELDAGRRAVQEVRDLSRGTLRLGMTPITEFLTTPLLDDFNTLYPGIVVSAMEMSQDEIEAGVIRDDIDVRIAFSNTLLNDARSNDIESHVLCIESLNLAVGEGHPLAGRKAPLSGEELGRETMVLLNTHFALRRHFDLYCLEHGISPRIAIESNSVSVIVEILRLGRHVTVLPNTIALAQPGLYPVLVEPQLPNHSITLISRKGAYKSQACRAFGNMAAEFAVSCANKAPSPKATLRAVQDAARPKERKFSTGEV